MSLCSSTLHFPVNFFHPFHFLRLVCSFPRWLSSENMFFDLVPLTIHRELNSYSRQACVLGGWSRLRWCSGTIIRSPCDCWSSSSRRVVSLTFLHTPCFISVPIIWTAVKRGLRNEYDPDLDLSAYMKVCTLKEPTFSSLCSRPSEVELKLFSRALYLSSTIRALSSESRGALKAICPVWRRWTSESNA
jgi:hypothetical protein